MRRIGVTSARVAVLGFGVLLGGCTAWNNSTTWLNNSGARTTDRIADAGAWMNAPWGSTRPTLPEGSATVARLSGAPVKTTPLTPEPGDVWPVPEAPRSTLANPDAAMRGIPAYRPSELDRPSGRPESLPGGQSNAAPLPPGLRSGASSAPPIESNPAPRRADGRTIMTPQGAAVTTGGTDRVQSFTAPGGGTGTAIIDGNTTTLIGPGGQVQSVPTRR
ncbi:MAG: hypothetical protein ACOYOH_02130 [Paracraurococcus sp.]|jgi:hypothetical protein